MFVHQYDEDDELKLWLLCHYNEKIGEYLIHAFSDDKDMFNAYRSIHNDKVFKATTVKGRSTEIMPIVNQNLHAEIEWHNFRTVDPETKKLKTVPVPVTRDEMDTYNDALKVMSFNQDDELYHYLYNNIEYLKDEYIEALAAIKLDEVCVYILGRPGSMDFLDQCKLDELRFFCKVHAETF